MYRILFTLTITCLLQELQTNLSEVEVIINNAPLIYVYPDTIKTCLTPSYLLFSRQQVLSSNTTSTVAENLTVLPNGYGKGTKVKARNSFNW